MAVIVTIHFMTVSGRANTRLDLTALPPLEDSKPTASQTVDEEGADAVGEMLKPTVPHRVTNSHQGRALKTRRQSIAEGVAMVQKLGGALASGSSSEGEQEASDTDSSEEREIVWEDADVYDPDLEENEGLFELLPAGVIRWEDEGDMWDPDIDANKDVFIQPKMCVSKDLAQGREKLKERAITASSITLEEEEEEEEEEDKRIDKESDFVEDWHNEDELPDEREETSRLNSREAEAVAPQVKAAMDSMWELIDDEDWNTNIRPLIDGYSDY
jgi:hypothetical protein